MTITIDIHEINTIEDVERFFVLLYIDRIRFHPEVSFHEHVLCKNGKVVGQTFTPEEADRLDKLMDECWSIVGYDIFDVAMEMDKKVRGDKSVSPST